MSLASTMRPLLRSSLGQRARPWHQSARRATEAVEVEPVAEPLVSPVQRPWRPARSGRPARSSRSYRPPVCLKGLVRSSGSYLPPRLPRKPRRGQTNVLAYVPPLRPERANWSCRPACHGGRGGRACHDPRPARRRGRRGRTGRAAPRAVEVGEDAPVVTPALRATEAGKVEHVMPCDPCAAKVSEVDGRNH